MGGLTGAAHPSATQATVATGILVQVLLVIRLGVVKRPGRANLGGQPPQSIFSERFLIAGGRAFGNLPLGITLVLDVGVEKKFVSRFLETAPQQEKLLFTDW